MTDLARLALAAVALAAILAAGVVHRRGTIERDALRDIVDNLEELVLLGDKGTSVIPYRLACRCAATKRHGIVCSCSGLREVAESDLNDLLSMLSQ